MGLIKTYGRMWARNVRNIQEVARHKGDGVYILYDGSTPVYVGMGNIPSRLKKARLSKRRGQMWDHFGWYIPSDPELIHDIEALLLKMLPPYLRILNRQKGTLQKAHKVTETDKHPDVITRKMPAKRKS
jgi:hypothetical protein